MSSQSSLAAALEGARGVSSRSKNGRRRETGLNYNVMSSGRSYQFPWIAAIHWRPLAEESNIHEIDFFSMPLGVRLHATVIDHREVGRKTETFPPASWPATINDVTVVSAIVIRNYRIQFVG